jgi:hypothetical protein
MPELKEVFDMTTKQIEPDLDAWRDQEHRQRRAVRNRKVGAIAVVAVIAIVAGALIARSVGGSSTQPGARPSPSATPFDPTVTTVANGFVQAFGDFDANGVLRYLADDAVIQLEATSPEELPLLISFWKAMGYEQILDGACAVTGSHAAGTVVRCPFDFHAIRSDEIGLGPYSGSYWDLTVRDGEIVIVSEHLEIETFSGEMWEPFATWVSENHPEDGAVMFNGNYTNFELTKRSIRLWEKRTREYVDELAR